MKSLGVRVLAALTVAAVGVLITAQPAAAAPAIGLSEISFSTEHVDVTQSPNEVVLSFTVTDADPTAVEISGSVEIQQFVGITTIGPPTTIPYDAQLMETTPGAARRATVRMYFNVPRYGATAEAIWRVTKLTAHDGSGNSRTLKGRALAAFGAEFGVTQLVDADGPVLDRIALGPDQSAYVVDPGTGVTLDYRVTVTDLQAGFWKGRLVLAGPNDLRVISPFVVAFDGRHLTCGSDSLISDIYDHVECDVPVVIPAGTPAGTWTVARVALTDQAGNSVVIAQPAGPTVYVTRE